MEKLVDRCFNPCFSGSYIMTSIMDLVPLAVFGFNPCFSGSYIMTESHRSWGCSK